MQWPTTMEMPLPLEIVIMTTTVLITVLQNTEVDGGTIPVIILTSMANTYLTELAQVMMFSNSAGVMVMDQGMFTSLKFK